MRSLHMNLGDSSYDILIEKGILSSLNKYVSEVYKNSKIYVITDTNVGPLYFSKIKEALNGYEVFEVVVEAGEASKSFKTYQDVLEKLIDLDIRRNELLIALGGGVVGDLTGFVASSIYRGVPYIQIPTSLLSQMDSSIGGKTGIDFYNRKNIIGAFKQPIRVIIDPSTLDTLPPCEFNNGMGELIKHGVIGNKSLLDRLVSHPSIDEEIISESLSVKKALVELDPFDQGERMKLNFGHTFGHIIELKEHYKHGEAIALGMLMALEFGIDLGLTNKDTYETLYNILKGYNLPVRKYSYKEYLHDTIYDKKNLAGSLKFIFIKDFGDCFIKSFNEQDLKEFTYERKN